MKIEQYDAEYKYDYDLDIVNIQVKKEYAYKESVDFDAGVFLDLDNNNFPTNLEIISASKRLNVEKDFLINPDVNVNLSINCDLIKIDVYFRNNNEEHVLHFTDQHAENLKINDIETKFAIV